MPKAVPEELREDFLLGGLVNLTLLYFDQRHHGETVPYMWTVALIGTQCGSCAGDALGSSGPRALLERSVSQATKHHSQLHALSPWSRVETLYYAARLRMFLLAAAESYMMRAEVEDGFEDVAYSETALIYQALEDFPVTGQAGLVVGSIMPWAEAILFLAGAHARCRRCAYSQRIACQGWMLRPHSSCPNPASQAGDQNRLSKSTVAHG